MHEPYCLQRSCNFLHLFPHSGISGIFSNNGSSHCSWVECHILRVCSHKCCRLDVGWCSCILIVTVWIIRLPNENCGKCWVLFSKTKAVFFFVSAAATDVKSSSVWVCAEKQQQEFKTLCCCRMQERRVWRNELLLLERWSCRLRTPQKTPPSSLSCKRPSWCFLEEDRAKKVRKSGDEGQQVYRRESTIRRLITCVTLVLS